MSLSPDEIKVLCDDWVNTVRQEGGGFAIGGDSEQYRLLRNGLKYHELSFEQLIASSAGLTKVLLLPGLNTVIDQDHFGLWSWCAEIILSHESEMFDVQNEMEVKKLFELCIRASLANCQRPTRNREEWEQRVASDQQIPHNAKYFIQESSLALAYLGFPLLEAICKKVCHEYISMDGKVVTYFEVPNNYTGKLKKYNVGNRCSSLQHLLFLLQNKVASPELALEISGLRTHIETLDESKDPFQVIYDWRNQSLHGTTNFQTIGGTLLNISIIICLFEIKDNYEDIRVRTLDRCRWEAQSDRRPPWSFYPPY